MLTTRRASSRAPDDLVCLKESPNLLLQQTVSEEQRYTVETVSNMRSSQAIREGHEQARAERVVRQDRGGGAGDPRQGMLVCETGVHVVSATTDVVVVRAGG